MSTTDMIPALLPWTYTGADNERKLAGQVEKTMTTYDREMSDIYSRIPEGGMIDDNVIKYAERTTYDRRITAQLATTTMTFSGYIMGQQAMSSSLMRLHIEVGKVLERVSDGLQVIVTAVDYDTLTATVAAHGNTGALSDDTPDPVTYDILGIATTDDNETHTPLGVDFDWVLCGTQIFEALFRYGRTWKNQLMNKNLGIADKVEDQLKLIMDKLREDVAFSSLRGSPVYSGGSYKYGNEVERPTMTGILSAIRIAHETNGNTDVYKNAAGKKLTETMLNQLLYHMVVDEGARFDKGSWIIGCDQTTRQYISHFNKDSVQTRRDETRAGSFVQDFISNTGKVFPIVEDVAMRTGSLVVLNTADTKKGYMRGDDITVEELAKESRMGRKLISFQRYALLRQRRRQGYIYGLAQSYAA